jgi:hypothetical protein
LLWSELSARLGCLRKLEESILKCVTVMNECSVEVRQTRLSVWGFDGSALTHPHVSARTQTDKLQKQKEQIDDAQSGIAEANAESRELESRQLVRHTVSIETAEDVFTHWPLSLSLSLRTAVHRQAAASRR